MDHFGPSLSARSLNRSSIMDTRLEITLVHHCWQGVWAVRHTWLGITDPSLSATSLDRSSHPVRDHSSPSLLTRSFGRLSMMDIRLRITLVYHRRQGVLANLNDGHLVRDHSDPSLLTRSLDQYSTMDTQWGIAQSITDSKKFGSIVNDQHPVRNHSGPSFPQ